jgi:hypothetical protein
MTNRLFKSIGAGVRKAWLLWILIGVMGMQALGQTTITTRISCGEDDVEQLGPAAVYLDGPGTMYNSGSDLELVTDLESPSSDVQTVGLRFNNQTIPQGATITSAKLIFRAVSADSPNDNTGATSLTIQGQDVDDAPAFGTAKNYLSGITKTTASASWTPGSWTTGTDYDSSSIAGVVQEIVDRSGWSSGNDMVFVITGTGSRSTPSYDGSSSTAAQLQITYIVPVTLDGTVSRRVAASSDDAEEKSDGTMDISGSDMEMMSGNSVVGVRFTNLAIPAGATINSAYLEFVCEEADNADPSVLTIIGEDIDSASAFSSGSGNISARAQTSATVSWDDEPDWSVGSAYQSTDIAAIVQEICDRTGWSSGNSMVFMITGTGNRSAEPYDGSPSCAPLLSVTYTEIPPITLSASVTDATCPGTGSITLTATGGTEPYSYVWTSGAGGSGSGSGLSITSLDADKYNITITDDLGSSNEIDVTVGGPAALSLQFSSTYLSSAGAGDGAIDLTVSGGVPNESAPLYTYAWTKDGSAFATTEDLSGLSAGTYAVTVQDACPTEVTGSVGMTVARTKQLYLTDPSQGLDRIDPVAAADTTTTTTAILGGGEPELEMATYLGAANADFAQAVAVDADGYIYVTGYTLLSDFPTTSGAYDESRNGLNDVFVTKMNPAGSSVIWSTYLGGSGNDEGHGISVDDSGNVYITGHTFSSDFPTVNACDTSLGGDSDIFVAKLSADGGSLLYSTYLGGSGRETMDDESQVLVGSTVYLQGSTFSADYPLLNAFDSSLGGTKDICVSAVDTSISGSGGLQFSTYVGGSGYDYAGGFDVDAAGNMYIAGFLSSGSWTTPTTGAFDSTANGDQDGFLLKLGPTGANLYATYIGGNDYDAPNGLTVDSDGFVYLTGITQSTDFPVTAGAFDETATALGNNDVFVVKIDPAGNGADDLIYGTYIGGTNAEYGRSIQVQSGIITVSGYGLSADYPLVDEIQTLGGSADLFISRINPAGNSTSDLIASTYLGGAEYELASAMVLDASGAAYIAGSTKSSDFPATTGAYDETFGGNSSYDGLIAKIGFTGGGAGVATTFTQGTALCSDLDLPAGSTVTASLTVNEVVGTLTGSSDVTAVVKYGTTPIANLTNAGISGGVLTLSGTALVGTIPAGQAVVLEITNNELSTTFTIDYDSQSAPSKIEFETATYITMDSFALYDAPYPGGSLLTDVNAGVPSYVRITASDPFGAYDVTSADLEITDPSSGSTTVTLTDADVVASPSCGKTYEYAFTPSAVGSWTLDATAYEGTEGVSASATLSPDAAAYVLAVNDTAFIQPPAAVVINPLANDLGVADPTSVTNVGTPAAQGSVAVNPVTGVITYTPDAGFTGSDTFQYQVCSADDGAVCSVATVTVRDAAAKQLYLTDPAQGLDRIDPVAAGDTTTSTSAVLSVTGGWEYKRNITFNNATRSENLSEFPVLIKLDSSRIDYSNTQDNGEDLRFFDSDDTTPLSFEIESWDESGFSYVWVNVPQVDGSSCTDNIWMYYGNASVSDGQDAAGTWNSGYQGVWHMNETSGTHYDSTANSNDGAPVGGLTQNTTGRIGGASDFDGSDDGVSIPDSASLDITSALTLSAWIEPDDANIFARFVDKSHTSDTQPWTMYGLYMHTTQSTLLQLNHYGTGYAEVGDTTVPLNQWTYVSGTWDGTEKKVFFNGSPDGSSTDSTFTLETNDQPLTIGKASYGTTSHFDGKIDEVRVSNVERSEDWIAAQYASMTDAFATYGAEESAGGGVLQATFTQATAMCSALELPSGSAVTADLYLNVSEGTVTGSSDVSAEVRYGATVIASLSNAGFSGGVLSLSGTLASDMTVPAGSALEIEVANNETNVSFAIEYDSQTRPSKVVLETAAYITMDSFALYDAPYPDGSLITDVNAGIPSYVRIAASDPFGAYDVTSADLEITDPSSGLTTVTLTDADVVASTSCGKTYEYAFTPSAVGSWTLDATAYEGTEGVSASATLSPDAAAYVLAVSDDAIVVPPDAVAIDVLANDLGFTDPTNVTIVGTAAAQGSVAVNATTGVITYTPDAGFVGGDVFQYQVCSADDGAVCSTGTVTVSDCDATASENKIGGAVFFEVLPDDGAYTFGETLLSGLTVNLYSDANGNGLLDDGQSAPLQTTASAANGRYSFTTTATGSYIVQIDVSDQQGNYQAASLSSGSVTFGALGSCQNALNLGAAAVATAVADFATVVDAPATIDVLANDIGNLDVSSVQVTSSPGFGSIVINGNGSLTYSPGATYAGIDSFQYQVCSADDANVCSTGTVTVRAGAVKQLYLTDPAQGLDRIDPVATADGTTASSLTLSATGGSGGSTSHDDFSTAGYNNFPAEWTAAWSESSDDGSAAGGTIQVVAGELRFSQAGTLDHIQRSVDLTGADSATLSFSWRTDNLEENVEVWVSNASDGTFTRLAVYSGAEASGTGSFDITAYISSQTTIRFRNSDADWTAEDDQAFFDDIAIDTTSTASGSAAFTQTPAFCSDFTILSDTLDVSTYLTVTSGTMPANPTNITATLKYGSTPIITLSNPAYDSGTGLLTWSGSPGADVTVPAGQAIRLEITNAQSGVEFQIDYDSQTKPSKIELLTSTYITMDDFALYDAPYPDGSLLTDVNAGVPSYVRITASDPFGAYDVTGADLLITDPSSGSTTVTLTDADVAASTTCGKIYEVAFTPSVVGSWTLDAIAYEGTEGVTATATLSPDAVAYVLAVSDDAIVVPPDALAIDVLANDLGFTDPAGVTIVGTPAAQGAVAVNSTTGVITYTPDTGFVGVDVFQYQVCSADDGAVCSTGTVTVTDCDATASENKIGGAVFFETLPDDGAYTFGETLLSGLTVNLYSDANGNGLLDDGQSAPLQTTASAANGRYSFTTTATGSYIVQIDVSDQQGNYQAASLSSGSVTFGALGSCQNALNLGAAAVATAVADFATVVDAPATIDVLANDIGNLDVSSVQVTSSPAFGSIVNNGNGSLTYSPGATYPGSDSFQYSVCSADDPNACSTGTVSVAAIVTKQLYLTDSYALDRIDPVATVDGTTATTVELGGEELATVVLDKTTTKSSLTSPVTVAHTTGTGQNRLMLVGISQKAETIASVTYGGTALTLVGQNIANGNAKMHLYKLVNPPSGAANVVVTFDGDPDKGAIVGVSTFTGVDPADALGTFVSASGNTVNPSISVPSAAGQLVFDVAAKRQNTLSIGAGQTANWAVLSGSEINGYSSTEPGASPTVTMSWTGASSEQAIGGVSIKPALVIGATSVTFAQSPALCSQLDLASGSSIQATLHVNAITGTLTGTTDVTAVLKYGSTTIANLSNAGVSGGVMTLSGPVLISSVPAGAQIELTVSNNEPLATTFTIDYDSQAKPSKIELQTSTFIEVDALEIYTAAYPDGEPASQLVNGESYYARIAVSDPFGAYDVNGVDLSITDDLSNTINATLGAAAVVDSGSCVKTYEQAFAVSAAANAYSFAATAHEGYEGTVTGSAGLDDVPVVGIDAIDDTLTVASGSLGPLDVLANDLGDLDAATLLILVQPQSGSLQMETSGVITYLPNGDFSGTDQYVYQICNTDAECDIAVVTVTVEPDYTDPCSEAVVAKTFYMPYPENDEQLGEALKQSSTGTGTGYSTVMRNVTSIKCPYPNTVITYDHWEDGYEADITVPLQSSTEIWGDGNLLNGTAPGYPLDILPSGASLILDNNFIYSPRDSSDIYYDGRDKVYTTSDVAISKITGDNTYFSIQSAKTTVVDTSRYGTLFRLGLGEIASAPYFAYASLFVTASEDGTVVSLDLDADGDVDLTESLDEGEVWFYEGDPDDDAIATATDIKPGTIVTANNPVGVDLLFGGNDRFGTRNINVLPGQFYGDTYYTPVTTTETDGSAPSIVYFVNGLSTNITINWQSGTGTPSTGSVAVAEHSYSSLQLDNLSGYKFWSAGGRSFSAVQIMDADSGGSTYDWAFPLISAERLTDFTSIAWAPGSLDGSRNDNPIWVTPVSNTTLYIKYDGDLTATNALMSPCGVPYDEAVALNALSYYQVKDTNDNDQSGTALFTCDGTVFAAVYGEDAATADSASPSLDVGTILAPMCRRILVNAVDDRRVTRPDTPIRIDVQDNDTSFLTTIDPLSTSTNGLLQPANGTVAVNADGTVTYTPDPGFLGEDSFGYSICSSEYPYPEACDFATVIVVVTDCNATGEEILIGGKVFLELQPDDGAYSNETFVEGIQVDLYGDVNCNGIIDGGDAAGQSTITDSLGNYLFSSLNGHSSLDDFDPVAAFTGNDGSLNWSSSWVEQGDDSSVSSGDVRILQDSTTLNNAIRIGGANNGISRSLSFSGATAAILEFRVRRQGLDDEGEELLVLVNGTQVYSVDDGGAVGTDNYYQTLSIPLTSFNANAANTVLFMSNGSPGSTDYYWVDRVKLTYIVTPVCLIAKVNTDVSGGSYSDALLNQAAFSFASLGVCTNDNYLGVSPHLAASDDTAGTAIDIPVRIEVLANDVAGKPDSSTVSTNGLLQPANGTIVINSGGSITYTPNPGYIGVDTFEYQVCSLEDPGLCDVALVTVTVSCVSIPGQNTIIGRLFNDLNGDGTLDAGEDGYSGWLVNLYKDSDGDGVLDSGEPLTDSQVSSALGGYQFDITPPVATNTYLDRFSTAGVGTGSQGTTPWTTAWQEITESDGFAKGDIQVTDGYLQIKKKTKGAYRVANLFGAVTATLSYDYNKIKFDSTDYTLTVDVSTNGTSWSNLRTYTSPYEGTGSDSIDISGYISATTRIRFLVGTAQDAEMRFDNVQIRYTTYTAADYIVQLEQPLPADTVLTMPLPDPSGIQTASFTGAGQGDCENNFGLLELGTITGLVVEDLDGDGAGDANLAGVTVSLYEDTNGDGIGDTLLTSTVTAADGTYSFGSLPLGDYVLVETDPAGTTSFSDQDSSDDGDNAANTDSNDNTLPVTITFGEIDADNTFVDMRPVTVSGAVLEDVDGDGSFDAADTNGLAGVIIQLLDATSSVVATTATADDGSYSFSDVAPGSYIVRELADPAGFVSSGDTAGANDNLIPIAVTGGTDSAGNNFLDTRSGRIGDRIWLDENGDGVQDAGESGIANVMVTASNTVTGVVSTNWTDRTGGYLFGDLLAGGYTVRVDTGSLPAGLAANPTFDPDVSIDSATAVALTVGVTVDTADFGYNWAPPADTDNGTGTGAIGDRLWIDADGDGVQDANEAGLGGIAVVLYGDPDGNGVYNTLLDSTTTDAAGGYIFDGIAAGAYVVEVNGGDDPAGTTQTGDPDNGTPDNRTDPIVLAPGDVFVNADFGYAPDTGSAISGTVYFDADADSDLNNSDLGVSGVTVALLDSNAVVIATTRTDAGGAYTFPGLPVGDYTVRVNDTAGLLGSLARTEDPDATVDDRTPVSVDGTTDVTGKDFGYTSSGHSTGQGLIGDTIYLDRDGDGFDAGEGLEGIAVELVDSGGTAVAEAVTDRNGQYAFGGLADGTYTVRVDSSTLPSGLTNSADPDGGFDSESAVTISGGAVDLGQDFGFAAAAPNRIEGTVWNDRNADGTLDAAESNGYFSVTVTLLDSSGNVMAVTTTDADGNYSFGGLPDGTYTVDLTDDANVLNGTWHSAGTAGTDGQSQSDPYVVAVSGGTTFPADFGYYIEGAALGNRVWNDANGDGIQDDGESGMSGVSVYLEIRYTAVTSTVVTVSGTGGFYRFGNLLLDEDTDGAGAGEPVFILSVGNVASLNHTVHDKNDAADCDDSDRPLGVVALTGQGQSNVDFGATPAGDAVSGWYDFGFTAQSTISVISAVRSELVDGVAVISWDVEMELDTAGYWLERRTDDAWVRVNTTLIYPDWFAVGTRTYEQADPDAPTGTVQRYRIVELDNQGRQTAYGPYDLALDGGEVSFVTWAAAIEWARADSGPSADPDGDGLSSFQEYLSGTDPLSANSVLRITRVSPVGDGLEVRWSSETGKVYTVQMSTSLTEAFWPVATGLPADPPENSYVVPVDAVSVRNAFFRVILAQ